MTRWARIRYQLNRLAYLSEIMLNPIVLSPIIGSMAGISFWKLMTLAISLKIILEYLNFLIINDNDRRRPRWHFTFPFMVVAKDLIFLAVYLMPLFSSQVEWRGGRIRAGKNSLIHLPSSSNKLVYEEDLNCPSYLRSFNRVKNSLNSLK